MSDSYCPYCGEKFMGTQNYKYMKRFDKHAEECKSRKEREEELEQEKVSQEKVDNTFIHILYPEFGHDKASKLLEALKMYLEHQDV
jgi:protein-disulfide isomerase